MPYRVAQQQTLLNSLLAALTPSYDDWTKPLAELDEVTQALLKDVAKSFPEMAPFAQIPSLLAFITGWVRVNTGCTVKWKVGQDTRKIISAQLIIPPGPTLDDLIRHSTRRDLPPDEDEEEDNPDQDEEDVMDEIYERDREDEDE
jgi:hypothetical protein